MMDCLREIATAIGPAAIGFAIGWSSHVLLRAIKDPPRGWGDL